MKDEFTLLNEFTESIKHKNRFFVNKDITDKFDEIINSSKYVIKAGKKLYRGRVIEPQGDEFQPLPPSEFGIPPVDKTQNGRANPIGINYMYLALNPKTVIAEMRENIDSIIQIATFLVLSDVTVIKFGKFAIYNYGEFDYSVFHVMLSNLFSRPVNRENSNIEYLPTQFFAEYCKSKPGINGLMFLSSVMDNRAKDNFNVTLFDESQVKYMDSKMYKIQNIKYKYGEYTNQGLIKLESELAAQEDEN